MGRGIGVFLLRHLFSLFYRGINKISPIVFIVEYLHLNALNCVCFGKK